MENLERVLSSLLKDAMTLPEEKMRLGLLGKRLKTLTPVEIATLLDMLYRAPQITAVRRLKSILVAPDGLMEAIGDEIYRRVYLASIELGLKRVSRLFTNLPPHKKGICGYMAEEEAKMEFISLGQRRSMAKSQKKDTLDRLLSDPDPVVIANLLANPRMTEKEILKIASKRPNSPQILKLLATHKKWAKRYSVIKAIVMNPYTPPRLSAGLIEFLLLQDIKKIAGDRTLHPQVKLCAAETLEERTGDIRH